jgi:hypothetical protein
MVRWKELFASDITLLDHAVWSSSISREALATGPSFHGEPADARGAGAGACRCSAQQ